MYRQNRLKEWRRYITCTLIKKKGSVAMLMTDEVDFWTRNITRDKSSHFIMIKGTAYKEDIKILSMYPNNRLLIHVKQKPMGQKKKDKSIIIIGGFHTLFSGDLGNFNT